MHLVLNNKKVATSVLMVVLKICAFSFLLYQYTLFVQQNDFKQVTLAQMVNFTLGLVVLYCVALLAIRAYAVLFKQLIAFNKAKANGEALEKAPFKELVKAYLSDNIVLLIVFVVCIIVTL